MSVVSNPKLADVKAAFEAIEEEGSQLRFCDSGGDIASTDVRSVAFYNYYLLVTLRASEQVRGQLVVIDLTNHRVVQSRELQDPYSELGGIAVIGDYLVVPIADSRRELARVRTLHLASMSTLEAPRVMNRVLELDHNCSAVGATNFERAGLQHYLLALYDDGAVHFRLSNGYIWSDENCSMEPFFEAKLKEKTYSQVALVTEQTERVYLLGFRNERTLLGRSDFVDLYEVDTERRSLRRVGSRRLLMQHEHGAAPGADGSHFTWGAGVRIRMDDSMSFFAPQRAFGPKGYYGNEFAPRSAIG